MEKYIMPTRQTSNSFSISFTTTDGCTAIPYSWLKEASMDLSCSVITLDYSFAQVAIVGTNLTKLYKSIIKMGIEFIYPIEADRKSLDNDLLSKLVAESLDIVTYRTPEMKNKPEELSVTKVGITRFDEEE